MNKREKLRLKIFQLDRDTAQAAPKTRGGGLEASPISKGERPNETLDKVNQEYKLSVGLYSDLRSLEANT